MDVCCACCGEPWAVDHLLHDAIFETELDPSEAAAWRRLPPALKYQPRYRAALKQAGYVFGATIINVIGCPACPPTAQAGAAVLAQRVALDTVLGHDEDGLAAELADLAD